MEQAKFTQGEWSVLEHDDRVFVLADGALTVAEVTYQLLHAGVQGSSQLQNARLMAAAPALLEALQGLLPVTFAGFPTREEEVAHWTREHELGNGTAKYVLAGYAAIHKALGS